MYHKWRSSDVWFLRYGVPWAELLFWTNFCPFTPLTTQKIKILIKWKQKQKHLEISLFYTSVPKIVIICYTVPAIWRVMDVIFFSFWAIFLPFYPPNDPKNQNIKKLNKLLDIIILHMCTKNYDHLMYSSWEMVRYRQMDIRTDGKSDITRWVPHLQIDFFPAFLAFSARVTIMFFYNDHFPILLMLSFSTESQRHKSLWKFNNSLVSKLKMSWKTENPHNFNSKHTLWEKSSCKKTQQNKTKKNNNKEIPKNEKKN